MAVTHKMRSRYRAKFMTASLPKQAAATQRPFQFLKPLRAGQKQSCYLNSEAALNVLLSSGSSFVWLGLLSSGSF
jgi:hypothetical protein